MMVQLLQGRYVMCGLCAMLAIAAALGILSVVGVA